MSRSIANNAARILLLFALTLSLAAGADTVEALIDAGRLAEARSLLDARPRNARTVFLEAMILHKERRHRESLVKLASVEEALKDRPEFLKLSGLNLIALGSTLPAGPYFQRAVDLAPDDAMARYYLGLFRLRTREPVPAEAEFRRSLALDARHIDTHFMLGLALEQQGKTEAALAAYERAAVVAADRGERYAPPHLYAGRLLYGIGRFADSIVHLRDAVQADPESAEAWFQLGKSLEQTGAATEAESAYRKALAQNPGDKSVRYRLMHLYVRTGRSEAAAEQRRALNSTSPD